MMYFLAVIEPILFWGGLIVFVVSLGMYAGRTKDMKSILQFWQPTIVFSPLENKVNRIGLAMMIVAVVIRVALFVML
jgi:hypothetical protein